jgi:3-(3-hydroxy-phenyl)propionate hydroxylase
MVCRGEAPDSLLDTYQVERAPHVAAIIEASIGMGQVVCLSDARAAAGRDTEMMAKRARDGDARGTPPLPPLIGGFLSETPLSGFPFPQTEAIRADGARGMLDDLLGGGFWLVTSSAHDIAVPSYVTLVRLGVELRDDGGKIAAWLAACGATAVLVRPDRIVFGTGEAEMLLTALAEKWGARQEASCETATA